MQCPATIHPLPATPAVRARLPEAPQKRNAGRAPWLRRILGLAAVAALQLVAPATATAAPVCGPGAHWVDACPGGIDFFPLTKGVHTIEIFGPMGGIFSLFTTGPTTVWRGPGTTIPDHHIDTELVALTLTGGGLTLTAGDGMGNGLSDGPLFSPGKIIEQAGDSTMADSFFDIFFEIDGLALQQSGLGKLHNIDPCVMETVLDQVPPKAGTTYVCDLTNPIFLFTANNHLTMPNQIVGQLTFTSHQIIPEPGSLALVAVALLAVVGLRRRVAVAR